MGIHLHGYECAEASAVEDGLAATELEAGVSRIRSFMSVQGSLAMFPIWKYGSEEHKRQRLPGLAAGELVGCFGLTEPESGSDAAELVPANVHLPADAVLAGVANMPGPLSCLREARYGILCGMVGAARACYKTALGYAAEREAFSGLIARFQLTQQRLMEMMVKVTRGTLSAPYLGRRKDEGRLTSAQVSFGNMDNVREARWVAHEARSLMGGNGITSEYPPILRKMNLESVYTYENTNEIQPMILGASHHRARRLQLSR